RGSRARSGAQRPRRRSDPSALGMRRTASWRRGRGGTSCSSAPAPWPRLRWAGGCCRSVPSAHGCRARTSVSTRSPRGWGSRAWGGLAFADLLAAYPPAPGARWAAMRSAVSLNGGGAIEPYYVSIDTETARHPQSLLATHHAGAPLTLAHGAPLRLVVPMKLGL